MKKNIRKARLKKLSQSKKDQSGFFSHYNTEIEERSRQKRLRDIDSKIERESLYDVSFNQEDSKADSNVNLSQNPLSTRYVPGTTRMGLHLGDGQVQDPLTNQIFDYRESFSKDGENYPGGSVSLQSSIMYLTSSLENNGHKKYSKRIFKMLSKLASIDKK